MHEPAMSKADPKQVVLDFNECINARDVEGLSRLMTEDHTLIDREGNVGHPRSAVVEGWKGFFEMFPGYRNTFTRVETIDNLVVVLGHAYWSEEEAFDPVIWTASVVDGLVREWRIFADTEANRRSFGLV